MSFASWWQNFIDLAPAQHFNAAMALLAFLAALGAANKMNKETERTIIFAFATTAAGLLGYVITTFFPSSYETALDSLLLGGVGAMVVGSRRRTVWLPPEWMPRFSASISGLTWVFFLFCVHP